MKLERAVIGCQSYWGSLPLNLEIEKSGERYQTVRDDYAGLYQRLDACSLHYAFCSTISLARNADFEMLQPLGISHVGASGLAYWGLSSSQVYIKEMIEERLRDLKEVFRWAQLHRTDNLKQGIRDFREGMAQLPPLSLDLIPSVRTTAGFSSWSSLSRLLYRLIFGVGQYESMLLMNGKSQTNGSAEAGNFMLDLRIENEALQKRCSFRSVIDLAECWRTVTGMPFVSSILQKNRRSPGMECKSTLREITELAERRMHIEPCNYLPDIAPRNIQQQSIDLCPIWKSLNYQLDAQELRSLLIFLYLAKPLEKKSLEDETFTLKMLRWQQRESYQSPHLS